MTIDQNKPYSERFTAQREDHNFRPKAGYKTSNIQK